MAQAFLAVRSVSEIAVAAGQQGCRSRNSFACEDWRIFETVIGLTKELTMWYYTFVVRSRVRQTAIPATSYALGLAKKSTNSSPCHTSAIYVGTPLIVNQVPA